MCAINPNKYLIMLICIFVTTLVGATGHIMTAKDRNDITPDRAIELLKEGNKRFKDSATIKRDYLEQTTQQTIDQFPFAAIVSCLDSRVAPEIIFDTNVGDIFVGRIAGNFVDTEMLGSLEFATTISGAKLIVILGHTDCGAIKGACDHVNLGFLTSTLSYITSAVQAVKDKFSVQTSKNPKFVAAVAKQNIIDNVNKILYQSEEIKKLVQAGNLKVVGAMYDIHTGNVIFY